MKCLTNLRRIAEGGVAHAAAHEGYYPLAGHLRLLDASPASVDDSEEVRYTYYRQPGWGPHATSFQAAIADTLGLKGGLEAHTFETQVAAEDLVDGYLRLFYCPAHIDATKTAERRSLACDAHDHARRRAAKRALRYEPVKFTGLQAWHVGRGIARAVAESGYRVLACSILPDHVHGVVERHGNPFERVIGHFKARATQELLAAGPHPFAEFRDACGRVPMVWVHRAWKVFLDDRVGIRRAIEYVEGNPEREGLPAQRWSFVTFEF